MDYYLLYFILNRLFNSVVEFLCVLFVISMASLKLLMETFYFQNSHLLNLGVSFTIFNFIAFTMRMCILLNTKERPADGQLGGAQPQTTATAGSTIY